MSKDLFTIDLQIFIQMFLKDFRKEQLGIKSPVTLVLSYGVMYNYVQSLLLKVQCFQLFEQ